MAEARKIITDFTGGEVGDRLMARIDTPIYNRTCRILENFIIHASGGADMRPGTEYIGEVRTGWEIGNGNVRLIPFVVSEGEVYVLELFPCADYVPMGSDPLSAFRVWKDGELIEVGAVALEIALPWDEAALFELKGVQTEDARYLSHPDYELVKIKYNSATSWVISDATSQLLLAATSYLTPFILVYTYNGGFFEKMADPDVLPTGITQGCAFSPDGRYLAVAHAVSPYITIYRREGNSWVKTTNPADLPGAVAYECAFSDDSEYLAVVNDTPTPCGYIYKRTGSTDPDFVQWAELNEIGTTGMACRFSPTIVEGGVSRKYLAIGSATGTPYLTIYKLFDVGSGPGDQLTALTLDDEPASAVYGCSFSSDGNYLAVAMTGSPYVRIYRRDGDVFTLLYGPETLPTGSGRGCSYSRSGGYLAVAHDVSPYVTIYRVIGETFIKVANPGTLPAGPGSACSFSRQDEYLSVAHDTTPFLTIYSISAGVFTKLDNPPVLPSSYGIDCNFATEGWIGVPWASTKPAALAFHEQRLVAARGRKQWASRTGYPQDWRQDPAQANLGYQYEFASEVLENVLWMLSKNHNIVMGTGFGEWLMTGGEQPITGANVYVEKVSAHGSANVSALLANESILFTQKGGQRLLEFMYSEERGGYISPDLTLLADHICAQGIREMAWQRSPRSILWVVMGNGELASLTLDRNHNIQAWARHPMDGTVDSVAVIPGADEDVVYLVVKHEISGAPVKYIERMKPIKRPADEKDYFFVDSGMTFDYSGYTATIGGEGLTKLPDASTLPTGIGRACAFSSEEALYLAIAHHSSPFITIYKRANESFTKLANPTTLPTGDGIGVAFSPDTVYLAVAHTANPVVTIYKRSGDTFEKLADPADLPAGVGCSAAFSPDSVYLAVGHTSWPYVTIYKRSGDTFTKLANPVTLPTGYGYGLAFSADGVYLAVAHATLPYVTIYKRSGDTFEKLADPADLPAGISNGIAFSPDCTYLGVAHYTTPFITIYKRDVDTFTKLANPAELPTEEGKACAFSADGSRLAVAHVDSPFITIYDRLEDTFTKATDPIPVPTGIGRGCVFSPEDMHLVVAHSTSPFVTVYSSQAATQSEPITLRISSHTFPSDGDMVDSFVRITGVVGMTELNGNAYMLKLLGPLTFELYETDGVTPVDGTDFGVYESGGVGVKVMNTLDGLDHLEGKYVMAYADGEALVKETMGVSGYLVTGGVITLDVYASKIHVGLPYTGKLWTQRLGGFSPVRIPEATLLLYKSRGGKIGADANSLKNIRYASDTLLTGPQEVRIGGAFSREGSIMIVQDQPLPMTVLGIVAEIVAGE